MEPAFIRIDWHEAEVLLLDAIQKKYNTKGKISFSKDYGYDGVGNHYDLPTYVDLTIDQESL